MITLDEIRHGLAQGEFFLEYLPTVSLADGRCVGAEALTRWRRPSGLVQPGEFIPFIEGTPLSGMLTYGVFEIVARELGHWLQVHKEAYISVNVPPEILGRGGLEYAAAKSGLSDVRNQIVLEITERGIPDNLGLTTLAEASQSGVRIALDDMTLTGTHLALLSRCTLDMIKTDKSLVDQITPECPRPAWLHGLSALLQSTRLTVVAEGVETEAQAEALRAAGIPLAQGYFFSPPISAEKLKADHSSAGGQAAKPTEPSDRDGHTVLARHHHDTCGVGLPMNIQETFARQTIELARQARLAGNQPFGALLVVDGTVILTAQNTVATDRDPTAHAETNLVANAIRHLSREQIRRGVLYTSCEPCAMCAGKMYWAGVRSVVYALSAEELAALAGRDFLIPCAELFGRAKEEVTITGPLLLQEARDVHLGFWSPPAV